MQTCPANPSKGRFCSAAASKFCLPGRATVFLAVALAGLLMLAGCAAIAPFASSITGAAPAASLEVHSQTSIRLEQGNFSTVRTNLVGQSRGFKLLGFITIVPATLDKAMNRLYAKAQAEEGRPQTLANLMVEKSGMYLILFSIPRVSVRADLVEFAAPRGSPGQGETSDHSE